MTNKERVIKTTQHEEPDRVPIGEWGVDHDHVSAILGRHTYWRNRKDTTLALWEGGRDEVVESLKRDYVDMVEAFGYDLLPVQLVPPKGPAPKDPPHQVADGVWEDSAGRVFKYCAANDSIRCTSSSPPVETLSDADVDAIRQRYLNIDESRFELLDFVAERYAHTQAVVFRGLGVYDLMMGWMGGDEAYRLMMTSLAPGEILKLQDTALEYNKRLLGHCAKVGVTIAMVGEDYGYNNGCIISPPSIRSMFFPGLKEVAAETTRLGIIPMFHCCGRIWDILDDWVDAGFQGYQSIQGSAGMDYPTVKAKYGDRITLWTGIQCETLVTGTTAEVEEEVKRTLEVCMPGGGFIFGSTNSVQFGAKTENYLKALEVLRRHGRYEA